MVDTLPTLLWVPAEILRYVVAVLLGFIGISLASDYWHGERLSVLLASGVYVAAAISSLLLFSWWPLIVAILLAWLLEEIETRGHNRNGIAG